MLEIWQYAVLYFLVAVVTSAFVTVGCDDYDEITFCAAAGALWPVSLPLLALGFVAYFFIRDKDQ